MYKLKYNRLLPGILALACIFCFTACDKKDDVSTPIQLLSFGPSGVQHGENISIIGNNLDKVTAVKMVGATIEQAAFVSQSRETIVLKVPAAAEAGKIILVTPEGDIESVATINFEVTVVVTGFPATARPGEQITITGSNMNWVTSITFAEGIIVTTFDSQSLDELKVTVPQNAQSGNLVLSYGGTEPKSVETETPITITLPAGASLSPNPVDRLAELTITGTDLDLVAGILFKGVVEPVETFVSQSATTLKVIVPEKTMGGDVILIAHSGLTTKVSETLKINGDLPPLDPLKVAFYRDDLENGWGKWGGWGSGSADIASTELVRDGEKSIKVTFASDWGGAMQIGGGNSSTTGATEFAMSIYGTPGTGGKKINVKIGGKMVEITLVEGEWTEYHFTMAQLDNPASINEIWMQDQGFAGVIYVDFIGLR